MKEFALLQCLGKRKIERVGETDVTEDSMRISSVIVNIFRKGVKAEPLQLRLQWMEA